MEPRSHREVLAVAKATGKRQDPPRPHPNRQGDQDLPSRLDERMAQQCSRCGQNPHPQHKGTVARPGQENTRI